MAIEDVLRRVENDLAHGHSFLAVQRLTTLVHENPKHLGLRSRLARVHLATGNFVHAGRWSYLTEVRDDRAIAAFEKAYRDPQARLAALRWSLDSGDPEHVRAIVEPLQDRAAQGTAEAKRQRARPLRRHKSGVQWVPVFFLFSFLGFFLLGVVTFTRWLWPG